MHRDERGTEIAHWLGSYGHYTPERRDALRLRPAFSEFMHAGAGHPNPRPLPSKGRGVRHDKVTVFPRHLNSPFPKRPGVKALGGLELNHGGIGELVVVRLLVRVPQHGQVIEKRGDKGDKAQKRDDREQAQDCLKARTAQCLILRY